MIFIVFLSDGLRFSADSGKGLIADTLKDFVVR